MAIRTEISLRLGNSPGALAFLCERLSESRIGITALMLEPGGRVRFVCDDPLRAITALEHERHQVDQRDVLFVTLPNTDGAAATSLAALVAEGVNIEYSYGGAPEGASAAVLVVGVEDAHRAAAVARW